MLLLTVSAVTSVIIRTARSHEPISMLVICQQLRLSHNAYIREDGRQYGTICRILFASHIYIFVCRICSQSLCGLQSLAKSVSTASALSHLGRRMCHQFPWLPDFCVVLGLALHERLISRGTGPSKTKDRTLIIQVSCGNRVGVGNSCFGPPCPHLFTDTCQFCYI